MGECGRTKKIANFLNTEKVSILKEKKVDRSGHVKKITFFSKNGHAYTQKCQYGRNIKHFLKLVVKKNKGKVGQKVDVHTLPESGLPKKKTVGFFTFF